MCKLLKWFIIKIFQNQITAPILLNASIALTAFCNIKIASWIEIKPVNWIKFNQLTCHLLLITNFLNLVLSSDCSFFFFFLSRWWWKENFLKIWLFFHSIIKRQIQINHWNQDKSKNVSQITMQIKLFNL